MSASQLDEFRREVNLSIACGALADVDLPVTSDDGGHPVVVALGGEPLSIVLGRLRAVGWFANLFVRDGDRVRMACVVTEACAIPISGGDMSAPDERPDPSADIAMFLDLVEQTPGGVLLSAPLDRRPAFARDAKQVDLTVV